MTTQAYVAVLYSIVLGDGKRLVMRDLTGMAETLGLLAPRTILATGNMVFFAAATDVPTLESRLETAFVARFGKHIDIVVRPAPAWQKLVAANPFPDEALADGSSVHVRVMRDPYPANAAADFQRYCQLGERLAVVDGDLWVHFPNGTDGTRLLPALSPKRHGIGTMRNWNTVRKLGDLLASPQ